MSQEERHELKFVLDPGRLAIAEQWLYQDTDLRKVYASRWVNSLYLDDTCFSAVHDNLAGISDRKKIRLRWYHAENKLDISTPVLEIKSRKNRLGSKDAHKVPDMGGRLLDLASNRIVPEIEKSLADPRLTSAHFDDFLAPAIHVSYQRNYFESPEGIRVTFDRNIQFTLPIPNKKILEGPSLAYPNIVMEVKFPCDLSDNVGGIIRTLPLSVKRHSKYLAGLASFGYVLYI